MNELRNLNDDAGANQYFTKKSKLQILLMTLGLVFVVMGLLVYLFQLGNYTLLSNGFLTIGLMFEILEKINEMTIAKKGGEKYHSIITYLIIYVGIIIFVWVG